MTIHKLKEKVASTDFEQHSYAFRRFVLDELRVYIPFASACFTTIDPESLLSTGTVMDKQLEPIHTLILENEHTGSDYNHYFQLVDSSPHIATLHDATGGNLTASQRYTRILAPAGFHDELRAALIDQGKCWGHLTLFRSKDHSPFSQEEQQLVNSLLPAITKKVKRLTFQSTFSPSPNSSHFEAAIMIFSDTFELLSANEAAHSLLSLLREQEQLGEGTFPRPIETLCVKIKATSSSKEEGEIDRWSVCIPAANGQLLTLYASKLTSELLPEQYAVISQNTSPFERLGYSLLYYGLTQREIQIVEQIVNGYTTKQISSHLYISTHTVQDHLKSIFSKMNVNSRRELLSFLNQANK
ncbi:LuxR C-terminal-related transcriptional regulator [Halalkalibacterium halodurans]|uniref:helix-turn-helix transcriptional regulator n=1 Tax=Halalkalibacterium halodurans TaxID=86665 RepID=UPI002E20C0A0|nr:LuxR C-terminal-related transcriptional regulator [Halalkalibacterium halodurans]MED3647600.1 LuxR C-terminal-related transcriptional regulator [Halalkalibacterium halodurans]